MAQEAHQTPDMFLNKREGLKLLINQFVLMLISYLLLFKMVRVPLLEKIKKMTKDLSLLKQGIQEAKSISLKSRFCNRLKFFLLKDLNLMLQKIMLCKVKDQTLQGHKLLEVQDQSKLQKGVLNMLVLMEQKKMVLKKEVLHLMLQTFLELKKELCKSRNHLQKK